MPYLQCVLHSAHKIKKSFFKQSVSRGNLAKGTWSIASVSLITWLNCSKYKNENFKLVSFVSFSRKSEAQYT